MRIGIIGMGLIGGSLGRTLCKKTSHQIFGMDIDPLVMDKALLLNACHEPLQDDDVLSLDVLIIALYPRAVETYIDKMAPLMKEGAVIMDCGGIKRPIVDLMQKKAAQFPHIEFIGTHPMAGREFSGISHASAYLFDKASLLMCPVKAQLDTLVNIKSLFLEMGFDQVIMTNAPKHDRIIAYTSQLAHILSNAYVKSPTATEHRGYSAGSFRDLTRVAKLNPTMWSELMMDNRQNLLQEINTLQSHLELYRKALEEKDEKTLALLLEEGVQAKKDVS